MYNTNLIKELAPSTVPKTILEIRNGKYDVVSNKQDVNNSFLLHVVRIPERRWGHAHVRNFTLS